MSVTHAEQGTIIVLNMMDLRSGYFCFSTTRAYDFQKLCRQVGGESNLLDVRMSVKGRRVISWECKVPVKYLSRRTFGIREPRGPWSDERREEFNRRLEEVRAFKKKG